MPARRADGRTVTYTAIESQMVVSYVTVPTTVVSTVHLTEKTVQAVPTTVVETQVATEVVTDTQVLNQYVFVPLSSERERSVTVERSCKRKRRWLPRSSPSLKHKSRRNSR